MTIGKDLESEVDLIAAGRGKWSQTGVPHKGWTCTTIADLGVPGPWCQMCESRQIRFVHYMTHPSYQGELAVGCICAGHMEENLAAAQERETSMRSRAGKRSRWLRRVWKTSTEGHQYLKADGYLVTVYPNADGWGATVKSLQGRYARQSKRFYSTPDAVKLAAFDVITHLLAKKQS